MRKLGALAIVATLATLIALPAAATPPVFVTICHAAGLEGTTQFVTLTLPEVAVFGQAGHFNEDGTPAAGHEADYLGECIVTTTTTGQESTTTTGSTTTTTQGETTTTAVEETTTTTAAPCAPGLIHQPPLCVDPSTTTLQTASVVPTTPAGEETLPFTGDWIQLVASIGGASMLGGLGLLSRSRRDP